MPKTRLARHRDRAFTAQGGLCWYCQLPMWLEDPDAFRARWNLCPVDVANRRCTAEHLRARQDGGTDRAENIVAACLKCNRCRPHRHASLPPDRYRALVRAQLQAGQWHRRRVLQAFRAWTTR